MSDSIDVAASPPASSRRPWFQGRRLWLLVGLVAAVAGLWLGWDWLAAAGVPPLLLALAPCAAMCALGLCMRGDKTGVCEQQAASPTGNQGKT